MRTRWVPWAVIVVLAAVVAAWSLGLLGWVRPLVHALARQPATADAFDDPLSGRTDALLMLVSMFLLTPVFLGILAGVIVFAVVVTLLLTEPVLRALRLPTWVCVPIVLAGLVWGAWAVRGTWVPQLMYVGGLAAKASLVFFSTPPKVLN